MKFFQKVVNQYKVLALEPGFAKIVQNVLPENLRSGETVSGPTIFLSCGYWNVVFAFGTHW